MRLTLAHPAHSHVRAWKARACKCALRAATVLQGCICRRERVHDSAALSDELRICHREVGILRRQCAERSHTPAVSTRYSQVYAVFHLMAAWHVRAVLSPPVLAVLAGMTAVDGLRGKCRCALRPQCGRCALQDTWHAADVHDAVQHMQLARPAYAAFSSVSAAVCARSSAMPAGSLSNVLGDSTAAPTGEIVP
jgi:hypothetical protein